MLKLVKRMSVLCLLSLCTVSTLSAFDLDLPEKMYIDEDDFSTKGDAFHIHIGHNVWLVTSTVHRDKTGLFTYECNVNRSLGINGHQMAYEKQWKCPYCYSYWPIGKPCGNKDCPSKYK